MIYIRNPVSEAVTISFAGDLAPGSPGRGPVNDIRRAVGPPALVRRRRGQFGMSPHERRVLEDARILFSLRGSVEEWMSCGNFNCRS